MSLCALIWSATEAQAIELDRPLMPQSALIWESEEAPRESLNTQKPVGTTWKKIELPSSGFVLQQRSWLALSIDAPRPGQMFGDLNEDGSVDWSDLDALSSLLGTCSTDVRRNGVTNFDDLVRILNEYNESCP